MPRKRSYALSGRSSSKVLRSTWAHVPWSDPVTVFWREGFCGGRRGSLRPRPSSPPRCDTSIDERAATTFRLSFPHDRPTACAGEKKVSSIRRSTVLTRTAHVVLLRTDTELSTLFPPAGRFPRAIWALLGRPSLNSICDDQSRQFLTVARPKTQKSHPLFRQEGRQSPPTRAHQPWRAWRHGRACPATGRAKRPPSAPPRPPPRPSPSTRRSTISCRFAPKTRQTQTESMHPWIIVQF